MFFKNGEATLPRGTLFPGLTLPSVRTASRERTGAPPPAVDQQDAALDEVTLIKLRSMVMISML